MFYMITSKMFTVSFYGLVIGTLFISMDNVFKCGQEKIYIVESGHKFIDTRFALDSIINKLTT